jgi:hypothetical protein
MEPQSAAHIFRGLMHLAVNASLNNACECKGGKETTSTVRVIWRRGFGRILVTA